MSGSMSRNKGARAERAVVAYLRQHGYPDARRYLAGDGRQPGDVDAIPGVSIEVKDQATYSISEWVAQAVHEAGERLPIVLMHPRGVRVDDVGNWWAVMRFSDVVELLE